ncbi:replication protein [Cedecea colo]|uniref:Replication protein n=1 Tax=Cedecea colo TaxID=2552946 RepID=A0ABX0VJT8_9ENTR|nr:replication protein [Cedecea colo]NIY47301.1 replication protein [Cedecea colo]
MENQKNGYIPLYRSVKKQPWAKDVYLRTLWENILLDAARQPFVANFKGHTWRLETGQLVTTSADLGLALCNRNGEPTSRHAVERMLTVFEKEGMISVHAERRKGTLITVLNYSEYAEKIPDLPAHNSAHNSAHNEASAGAASEVHPAHKTEHKAAHHEQEGNNNNKNLSSSRNSDESRNDATEKFLSRHPEAADGVYSPSGKLWGDADDFKAAQWLFARIALLDPSTPEPSWADWSNTVRLMRQQDNRSHHEICDLFKWANKHHFWAANILSPTSLRKQWQKLTAQRKQEGAAPTPIKSESWNTREAWQEFI